MTRRKAILLALLCLSLPLVIFAVQYGLFLRQPITPPAAVRLSITPGATIAQTALQLEKAGVIADAGDFRLLTRFKGQVGALKVGVYEFVKPAVPAEVLRRLVAGDVLMRRVTIPEGFSLKEIAARLEQLGFGSADETLRLTRDREFLRSLEITAPSLEGFLFPETYFIAVDASARQLLQLMVREFRKRLTPEIVQGAKARGLNVQQLVTLASIVQKEARRVEEMPTIASVYHNRLRIRMPLQADPTVIYGIENYNGNITKADLLRKTPYNTYRMYGLPPGPIASPGAEALMAVAFPAQTRYLYFVARGDGSHAFSENLIQHNEAVRRYQLRRRASGG